MSAAVHGSNLGGNTIPASGRGIFLSTDIVGRRESRFALGAVLVSGLLFAMAIPFARTPLPQVPAFVPMYASLLVMCDLLTAVLLFGQFRFMRSRALLVLAGGYLFTALVTAAYALIFPGLFTATGLLGAGSQSTSWIWMFWHGSFPLAVVTYARLKGEAPEATAPGIRARRSAWAAIVSTVTAVSVAAAAVTFFVTAGNEFLPVIIEGNRVTDRGHLILSSTWVLSLLALIVMWRQRPHTVIDLWLMVVMCVWLFDIALSALVNTGRYDLGWYGGRLYGLLAAGSLLAVLLVENGKYYARLVDLSTKLGVANISLEQLSLHDGLTGLANRRFFDKYLDDQMAVANRYKRSLALILCDVDAFKAYNDHYGHQAGDACLKRVAAAIGSCCRRPADLAARYGGEEFAMILPDTELAGAAQIAEAARNAIAQLRIPHAKSPASAFVSISGGVSVLLLKIENSAQQLIAAADQTLYQAKSEGRNRMVSTRAA